MTKNDVPLEDKVAVITGAARNIGRATAKRLAEYGVAVVVNAVQDREAADAVAHEIFEAGGRAIAHIADITDEDATKGLIDTAIKGFGSIDILFTVRNGYANYFSRFKKTFGVFLRFKYLSVVSSFPLKNRARIVQSLRDNV